MNSPRIVFDQGTLLFHSSTSRLPEVLSQQGRWQWDNRVRAWRCDAMDFWKLEPCLAAAQVTDTVPRWDVVRWGEINLPKLRRDQNEAIDAWSQTRRGVIVMPTGTGKTEVALSIMRDLSVSTLIVAPVRDLMYQWHRRIFERLGIDAGIIGDNIHRVETVSVTTYDSACIHMDKLGNKFGLIIFDECHHLPGGIRQDAARMSAAPYRLGLSATPERSDGRHVALNWLIGPTVYSLPLPTVKGNVLADYDVVRIPVYLTKDEQERYDECALIVRNFMRDQLQNDPDFTWQDMCALVGNDAAARKAQRAWWTKKSIEDRASEKLRVLEDIFRLHVDSRVIVFAGSNVMAREVSIRFLIPCLLSHCRKRERVAVLQGFQNGTYPALVANQVLDEGVDVPEAKVAVVIGGLASTRQAKQRLGRILRRNGDERAVLYEIVCAETTEEMRSRTRRSSDAFFQVRRTQQGIPRRTRC